MKLRAFFAVALASVAFSTPAHAYLDPGTGSILLQGLLGAIAAATVAVGAFWTRAKLFLFRLTGAQARAKTTKS